MNEIEQLLLQVRHEAQKGLSTDNYMQTALRQILVMTEELQEKTGHFGMFAATGHIGVKGTGI